MADSSSPHRALTSDDVRRVARLARLRPDADAVERYRAQLATILDHVSRLQQLELEGVEPLTHPSQGLEHSNRLDADEPLPPLPIADLQRMAPASEGRFVSVPKAIGDGAEGG